MTDSELLETDLALNPSDTPRSYLFYGPPGTGKTTTAASTRHKRKLFIDVDQKLASMENLKDRSGIAVWTPNETLSASGRIEIIRQERHDSKGRNVVVGTENYIPKNPRGYLRTVAFINELLNRAPLEYDLVVLDSFTILVEHLTRLIMSHHKTAVFSLPLWGVYKSNFQEFLAGFLALPCDKIMIGHSKTMQDEITKEVLVRPMLDGKMADDIGMHFNEVYYFNGCDRNSEYTVLTQASRKYIARTTKSLDASATINALL